MLDDGSTFAVDHDYVIGREPESSELVRRVGPDPWWSRTPSLRLSRVHAHILLREWEVCVEDAHSANGTSIRPPDSSSGSCSLPASRHPSLPALGSA